MPSQPKKVGGSKPFALKPGQIKKAPAPMMKPQESANQSPDVSRDGGQAALPKNMKKAAAGPAMMVKKVNKPAIGGPNFNQPRAVGKSKYAELDEEIDSLMPASMQERADPPPRQISPAKIQPTQQ